MYVANQIINKIINGAISYARFKSKQQTKNERTRANLDRRAKELAKKKAEKKRDIPVLPPELLNKGGMSMTDIHSLNAMDLDRIRLCGEIFAGYIYILFGVTGIGKSIALLQMLFDIAVGRVSTLFPPIPVCGMVNDVHLYDAELSYEQFRDRYPEGADYPRDHFHRYSPEDGYPPDMDTIYLLMEKSVEEATTSLTWGIDNITKLMEHNGNDAIKPFFKKVEQLQQKMREKGLYLTCIAVTHPASSKVNKAYTGDLTEDMVLGNTILATFATGLFGIHRSRKNDVNDDNPCFQIVKIRTKCNYHEFETKRVSKPYAMLQYNGSISESLLGNAVPIEKSIDFSPCGVEFMFEKLYMDCGLSIDDIANMYCLSPQRISQIFIEFFGGDYKDLRGEVKDIAKARELFRERRKYICPVPPEYKGEKAKL